MSGSKKSIEDVGNAKVSTEYHFLDRRCSWDIMCRFIWLFLLGYSF